MEYAALWRTPAGWQIRGTIVSAEQGHPMVVRYGVLADESWRTREVHVAVRAGGPERVIHLLADGQGAWTGNGNRLPDVEGCIDVDLEVTPSTNTLPIRRFNLAQDREVEVSGAWVRFPDLTVERLDQTYQRVNAEEYRYTSGSFQADLRVDDLGLVTSYQGLWRRIGEMNAFTEQNPA